MPAVLSSPLSSLLAEPSLGPSLKSDGRTAQRLLCLREGRVREIRLLPLPALPVLVCDTSSGGLGLLSARPLKAGTFLVVQIDGPGPASEFRVLVVHSTGGPAEAEKAELFEQIGRLKMELEWLKKKVGRIA